MKNKRILLLSVILFACFTLVILTFAHSGRTDSKGGHYDHINGGYHYHHGYPAHQHPYGLCPYAYEDEKNFWEDYYTKESQSNTIKIVAAITSTGALIGAVTILLVRKHKKTKQ